MDPMKSIFSINDFDCQFFDTYGTDTHFEMLLVELSRSNRSDKKWMVYFPGTQKRIHFGASGYEDYTMHKDSERKKRYDLRHSKKEDWENVYTAGFWAKWLLWNKPTIKSSMDDISKRFNVKIKMLD